MAMAGGIGGDTSDPSHATVNVLCHHLRDLIRRDIEPQGHRLILPFLTTMDRLRLSECCQGLRIYQSFLSHVTISPYRHANRDTLMALMERQTCLTSLHVGHQSLLSTLEPLGASGCLSKLEKVDLSPIKLTPDDWACIGRILSKGYFNTCQIFNLSGGLATVLPPDLALVTGALSHGVCPALRHLHISRHRFGRGASLKVLSMLQSGLFRRLLELDLSETWLGVGGGNLVEIAECLQKGACPELRRLMFNDCALHPADGQALAEALQAGACPNLEVLGLSNNDNLGDLGMAPVMGALESGACVNISHLHLANTWMSDVGAAALARALSSGSCSRLQGLYMFASCRSRAGMSHVMESIKHGGCPNLRHLDLSMTNLDREHGALLGDALANGELRHLEALVLCGNDVLEGPGLVPMIQALESGHLPHLKTLNLSDIRLRSQASVLAHALLSGRCRQLQSLDLSSALSDQAGTLQMLESLRNDSCPNLRYLDLSDCGIGRTHNRLLHEINGGKLEELILSNNALGNQGVANLAAALGEGRCPMLTQLILSNVKMGEIGAAALAQALGSLSLAHLQVLDVSKNGATKDHAMAEIVRGLRMCQKLRFLQSDGTGDGLESFAALVESLKDGVWPRLERIFLIESDLPDYCFVQLAATLMDGAASSLKRITLGLLDYEGMSRFAEGE